MGWRDTLIKGALAASLFASAIAAGAETVESIQTRPGVTQQFLFHPTPNAVAVLLLFPGGHGAMKFQSVNGKPKWSWGGGNFLVRTRDSMAKRGFAIAVFDAPSDRSGTGGMQDGFRNSQAHADDIAAVIADLKHKTGLPVWLVGTSRGTESVGNAAVRLSDGIAGIVLTSTITETNRHGHSLLEIDIKKIKVPTLLVAHEQDKCFVTPPSGARRLADGLKNSPKVELTFISGGDPPRSDDCEAFAAHGFVGVEERALDAIADFVKRETAPAAKKR